MVRLTADFGLRLFHVFISVDEQLGHVVAVGTHTGNAYVLAADDFR